MPEIALEALEESVSNVRFEADLVHTLTMTQQCAWIGSSTAISAISTADILLIYLRFSGKLSQSTICDMTTLLAERLGVQNSVLPVL